MMDKADKESMERLGIALEEAREAGVLDGCPHCDAAFDILEPYMKPDEAHIETIERILAEHDAAHKTLGLARDGDTLTALARGYSAYVEEARKLKALLDHANEHIAILALDIADIGHALFEPVYLGEGITPVKERILGAIEELARERTEARSLAHELATELGKRGA